MLVAYFYQTDDIAYV